MQRGFLVSLCPNQLTARERNETEILSYSEARYVAETRWLRGKKLTARDVTFPAAPEHRCLLFGRNYAAPGTTIPILFHPHLLIRQVAET
jgi:hypothetical protein